MSAESFLQYSLPALDFSGSANEEKTFFSLDLAIVKKVKYVRKTLASWFSAALGSTNYRQCLYFFCLNTPDLESSKQSGFPDFLKKYYFLPNSCLDFGGFLVHSS